MGSASAGATGGCPDWTPDWIADWRPDWPMPATDQPRRIAADARRPTRRVSGHILSDSCMGLLPFADTYDQHVEPTDYTDLESAYLPFTGPCASATPQYKSSDMLCDEARYRQSRSGSRHSRTAATLQTSAYPSGTFGACPLAEKDRGAVDWSVLRRNLPAFTDNSESVASVALWKAWHGCDG